MKTLINGLFLTVIILTALYFIASVGLMFWIDFPASFAQAAGGFSQWIIIIPMLGIVAMSIFSMWGCGRIIRRWWQARRAMRQNATVEA